MILTKEAFVIHTQILSRPISYDGKYSEPAPEETDEQTNWGVHLDSLRFKSTCWLAHRSLTIQILPTMVVTSAQ